MIELEKLHNAISRPFALAELKGEARKKIRWLVATGTMNAIEHIIDLAYELGKQGANKVDHDRN